MPDTNVTNDTQLDPTELQSTKMWFELAVPTPSTKNLHTQLGCHFEEVAEMLEGIHAGNLETAQILLEAEQAMIKLADHLKAGDNLVQIPTFMRIDFVDALADQIVTAVGVGHMLAMDAPGALGEANRSNWSKFVDGKPIFNENQKVMKGYKYIKGEFAPYV